MDINSSLQTLLDGIVRTHEKSLNVFHLCIACRPDYMYALPVSRIVEEGLHDPFNKTAAFSATSS